MFAMSTKSKRVRSPAYPAISLKAALKKVEDFYQIEGRNIAFLTVALSHLGYSPTSGSGLKVVAALSSYGLIDVVGSGKNRKMKLSELALRIVLDKRENQPEKIQLIQGLALKPKIHQKLWNLWGAEFPSIDSMCHHLIFEEGFNEKFVKNFVKDYRETIEFAQLKDDVTANGVAKDEEVAGIVNDLEDENAIAESSTSTNSKQQAAPVLSSAEIEIAKYPVAKNCTIRVIANGVVNRKAIEALVAQLNLNLQLGIFDDEPDIEN